MNPKLSAALASVIWGTSYICITQLLPHNPVFIAAVRALGGGIPLLLLSPRLPSRDWWGKIVLLGTLNCGVFFAFVFIAGGVVGGLIGTRIAKRLGSGGTLTTVFAVLIFVVATYMLWKSAAAFL